MMVPARADEDKGKPLAKSTTAWAAGLTAVATGSGAVKQIASDASAVGLLNPWLLLALVGVLAAVWIIRERRRHARESGV